MSKGGERRTFNKEAEDKFRKNKFWDKKIEPFTVEHVNAVFKEEYRRLEGVEGGKFDITNHNWFEGELSKPFNKIVEGRSCAFGVLVEGDSFSFVINKQDAIAIAKHFGLIPEFKDHNGQLYTFGESTTEMDRGGRSAFSNSAAKGVLRSGSDLNDFQGLVDRGAI
jgi:hypothetical protein